MIKYNSKSIALSKYGEPDPPHRWVNLHNGMPSGTRIILPDGTTGTFFKNTNKRNENMTDPKDIVWLGANAISGNAFTAKDASAPKFNEQLFEYRLEVYNTEYFVINDNLIVWDAGANTFDGAVASMITVGDSVVLQTTNNGRLTATIAMDGKVIAVYRDTNGSRLVIIVEWEGNLRYSGKLTEGRFCVV